MKDQIRKILDEQLAEAEMEKSNWELHTNSTGEETEGTYEEGYLTATEALVGKIIKALEEDEPLADDEHHYQVEFGFKTDVWASNPELAIEQAEYVYDKLGGAWDVTLLDE